MNPNNKISISLGSLTIITLLEVLKNCSLLHKLNQASTHPCTKNIIHTHCPHIIEITKQYNINNPENQVLVIHTLKEVVIIEMADIIHLKGFGHYTIFYLKGGIVQSYCGALSKYEKEVADFSNIIRVDRSHLINKLFMKKYDTNEIEKVQMTDNSKVPVSESYREALLNIFKNITLFNNNSFCYNI